MSLFGSWYPDRTATPYAATPRQAPGTSRGLISWLRDQVGNWLGPRLSQDTRAGRAVIDEKVNAGPWDITFPWFLPYQDADYTGETQEMRLAYRMMLACPPVKAAFLAKILSVCALDLKIRPAKKRSKRHGRIADFVRWNLTERLRDTVPGLVWSILSGGLVNGYSVCEKVWMREDRGEYAGNIVLSAVKAKDVDHDLVLQTDSYRNVIGLLGLRYNPGVEFAPSNFILFRHMPFYESPTGMSDFRAAYANFWMRDTVLKLRAMGATNRAFPILMANYLDKSQKSSVEAALANARSLSWLSLPADVQVKALEVAGGSDEYFRSFLEDLERGIVQSIEGAYLQSMQGTVSDGRGDSSVHDARSDLFKWYLSVCIQSLLNDRECGLIRDMVDLNYMSDRYPLATLSAIDTQELLNELKIDQGLSEMIPLSKEELYERYGRTPPRSRKDALMPQKRQAAGPAGKTNPNAAGEQPLPMDMSERPRRRRTPTIHLNGKARR